MFYVYKAPSADSYIDGLELAVIEALTEDSAKLIADKLGYSQWALISEKRLIHEVKSDYWWSDYLGKVKFYNLDEWNDLK